MPEARRPESVLVVVYTADRHCLLLERIAPRGFWQSVTGGLDWGETPREAAVRELGEETGLGAAGLRDSGIARSFPIMPGWRSRYAPEIDSNLEHLWYIEFPSPIDVRLNESEHRACEWLTLTDAAMRASSWTNREAIERLKRTINGR